ncbi:phosphatidylserine decarboxylase-domain-containing protein [Lactarius indigo]|nr:phosphatidylserine decarboxylase-domain-containing protein [Lactarius indigo]
MAFETISEATRLWIKGREFTIARLLGDAYKGQVERYAEGTLVIFRLAPQDYHRFHLPVDGTIGPMTFIAGEYYTVNPQVIRTTLDVYSENARKIVPIDSPQSGHGYTCDSVFATIQGCLVEVRGCSSPQAAQVALGQAGHQVRFSRVEPLPSFQTFFHRYVVPITTTWATALTGFSGN